MALVLSDPDLTTWNAVGTHRRTLIILYLIAIVVRAAAGLTISPVNFSTPLENDEPEYRQIARSLIDRGEYAMVVQQSPYQNPTPTAFRLPIPSLAFALGLELLGDSTTSLRMVSVLVSSLSAPLLYLFALKITTRPGALATALIGLAWPPWLVYSLTVLSEPFFVPALFLALNLSSDALASLRDRAFFHAGIAWGVASMVRPHGLPMVLLLACLIVCRGRFRGVLAVVLGFGLAVMPWTIRNAVNLGTPTFMETVGGETFLGSNNPYVLDRPELYGLWIAPLEVGEYRAHLAGFPDESDRNREQYQMGFAFVRENVGSLPRLAYYKLVRWLTPVTASRGAIRFAVLATYVPLVVLVGLGLVGRRYSWTPPLVLVSLWTFTLVVLCVVMWGILTRGRLLVELVWIPWAVDTALAWLGLRGGSEKSDCEPPII